jgi:hypothetical protein
VTDPNPQPGQEPGQGTPPVGTDPQDPPTDPAGKPGQEPPTDPPQDPPQDPPTDPPGEPKVYDDAYVSSLRTEAASYRTQRNEARARVQELEAARGTADEQLRTENDTLRTQNETLLGQIRRAAFIEAIKLPSPRLAYASLADAGVEVEWNEDNRPTNLADIRKALKREFPREFGDGSADGGDRTVNANGYQGKPGLDRLRHGYETNQRE